MWDIQKKQSHMKHEFLNTSMFRHEFPKTSILQSIESAPSHSPPSVQKKNIPVTPRGTDPPQLEYNVLVCI